MIKKCYDIYKRGGANLKFVCLLAVLQITLTGSFVLAGDISWSGRYRAEGIFLKTQKLDKDKSGLENSYILHHLVLKPKIVASDGVNILGRFDLFNNSLLNNQAGQALGQYSGSSTPPQPSAVQTRTQQDDAIAVTELYMNWINEWGALVVGRVPFNFGLGMAFNSGDDPFAHHLSTKDMVAYKITMGNITVTPGYGKVKESALTVEDDINDFIVIAEYKNEESDLSMGFLFDSKTATLDSTAGNDFPTSYFNQGNFTGAVMTDGYNAYNMNFYVKKKTEDFTLGAEVGFTSGFTGVKVTNSTNGSQERVELSGFGLAAEASYRTGSITLNLKAGLASGDDADTARFEGYMFSPNYDTGFLLFNYVMGQYDALRSTLSGSRLAQTSGVGTSVSNYYGLDTEVISNAMYFAPNIRWAIGEKWDVFGTFIYATTQKSPLPTAQGSVGSSLGFEGDLGVTYHPTDKIVWETTFGALFPGSTWSGVSSMNGGRGLPTDPAFGLTTKAAITF
ncbi:MAG: hypothetical protein IT289_10660 [Oligoflexia bacterium]|nr:hypothetical protein [Oligoflexia bacterium]